MQLMSKIKNVAIGLLVIAALVSCSSAKNNGNSPMAQQRLAMAMQQIEENKVAPAPAERAKGELAPGYELRMGCSRDKALNGKFRIEFDGKLKLPYEKTVDTSGMTLSQLESKVNDMYRDYFTESPGIGLTVSEKKFFVEVQGLVEKPGQYLVKEDESLDALISKAGGLQKATGTDPSRPTLARFVRMNQLGQESLLSLSDYYSGKARQSNWVGGERVFFQSDRGEGDLNALVPLNYVKLLGEVKEPGEYAFQPGADFFYYMVRAQGPTDRANMDWVTILRPEGVQMTSLSFSLEDDDEQPVILGGDTLILHAENPTAEQKKLGKTGILGSVFSTLATVALLFVSL